MNEFAKMADESEDFDSKTWGELSYELGLSKAETKKLMALIGELGEKYRRVRVSEGYELEGTRVVRGNDLDDELESDFTLTVLKVNGRWVSAFSSPDILEFLALDS